MDTGVIDGRSMETGDRGGIAENALPLGRDIHGVGGQIPLEDDVVGLVDNKLVAKNGGLQRGMPGVAAAVVHQ